ncbi:septation ring formation regulator EzrA [Alkalihalobacillus trypoxylicola]|uniref:TPM domain-containing protein n=1 Tax=Alkalihalobacillus trypoxylicola TaxID=519424 RepID=A0A161QN79_9BACI|nr:septation ring formation regulator EzrA [Alkalihalobacillus trypoxylicola]KYG31803.1 hypothetical protein AZF04_03215 [Alkalihalobacillus trypoxylicola]
MNRRGFILTFFIILISFCIPFYAEAALEISDDGQFFTSTEINNLESDFRNSDFDYFLQTVEAVEGDSIEQQAESLYEQLDVDAVILMSQEGEIYLSSWEGSTIDQVINQLSNSYDPYEALLDDTFIEYAKDGEFALGIETLVNEIENAALNSSGVNQSNQSDSGTSVTSSSSISAFDVILSLSIVAVFIAIVMVIFRIRSKKKIEKEIDDLKKRQQKLLSKVLNPYNKVSERLKLAKGDTEKSLNVLSQDFFDILQGAKDREQALTRLGIPKKYIELIKETEPIQEQTQLAEQRLPQLEQQMKEFFEKELIITKNIKEAMAEMDDLQKEFKQFTNSRNESYPVLEERILVLTERIQSAKSKESGFDFIGAEKILNTTLKPLEELKQDFFYLKQMVTEVKRISEQIKEHQNHLFNKTNQEKLNHLKNILTRYYTEAQAILEKMNEAITLGDVFKIKSDHDGIQEQLEQATETVEKWIEARDFSLQQVKNLNKEKETFNEQSSSLQQELNKLQSHYHDDHRLDLEDYLMTMKQNIDQLETQLPAIQLLLDEVDPNYLEIAKHLKPLVSNLEDSERFKEMIRNRFDELEGRKRSLLKSTSELKRKTNALLEKARSEALNIQTEALTTIVRDCKSLEQDMESTDKHLVKAENKLAEMNEGFQRINRIVEGALKEKRDAMREWQSVSRSYRDAQSQFGLLSSNSYQNKYLSNEQQVKRLLSKGDYRGAIAQMALISQLTQTMRTDHQRRLDEQRRRHSQNYTFRNNSGSSGFGSRGGGSSFGSKGNTSRGGGSSFGSRGGSSRGGGSSFGSRGGRSRGGGKRF